MKLKFRNRGVMWTLSTSVGFLRICKDIDGRWSSRWVKFNLFGRRKRNRIRHTVVEGRYSRTRIQVIHMWWAPYVLFYHAVNDKDIVEIVGARKEDMSWAETHSQN